MIISAGVENLTSWERKLLYMCNARPTINTRALFSDATNDYRCPAEPMPGDTVKIRLRTGRYNVDKAYIYVNNVEYPMTKIKAVGVFDYYEAAFIYSTASSIGITLASLKNADCKIVLVLLPIPISIALSIALIV